MESTQQFEQSYKELLIICTGLTTKRQEQRTLKNTLWLRERNRGSSWKGHLPPKADFTSHWRQCGPSTRKARSQLGYPSQSCSIVGRPKLMDKNRQAGTDQQEPLCRGTSMPRVEGREAQTVTGHTICQRGTYPP